jgi:simple sugar transport system permease protein
VRRILSRARAGLASFGLPRLLIAAFLVSLLAVAVVRKMDLDALLSDSLLRIGRNGILVLALLPGIQGGIGLNFGLPVGILAGLLGCVLTLQWSTGGWAGLTTAVALAIVFSLPAGWLYGRLLNRVKGQEMMVGTYTGFALVAGMSIFWLLAPLDNPAIVWAIGGRGLRTTLPLGGSFGGLLDRLLAFQIGGVTVPTGLFLVFFGLCGLVALFFRTRAGLALTAAGQNPLFARAAGIREEPMRILSAMLTTTLAAVGIVIFSSSYGFVQLYTAPLMMAFPAIACILDDRPRRLRHDPLPDDPDRGAPRDELGRPGGRLGGRAPHHPERHDPLCPHAPWLARPQAPAPRAPRRSEAAYPGSVGRSDGSSSRSSSSGSASSGSWSPVFRSPISRARS